MNSATARKDDEIVVSFEYSTKDHTRALERTPYLRLVQNGLIVLVVIYFGTEGYEWLQGEEPISDGWLWRILKGLMMFGGLTLPALVIRMVRSQDDTDGARQVFRFNSNGFALSEGAPLTPWGLMDRVTEVKGAFLLKDSLSKWPVYLPTDALSSNDLKRLRSILRAEFSSRPKNVKLLRGTP